MNIESPVNISGMKRYLILFTVVLFLTLMAIVASRFLSPYIRHATQQAEFERSYALWQRQNIMDYKLGVDYSRYDRYGMFGQESVFTIGLMAWTVDAKDWFRQAKDCIDSYHCEIWYDSVYGLPYYFRNRSEDNGLIIVHFEVAGDMKRDRYGQAQK